MRSSIFVLLSIWLLSSCQGQHSPAVTTVNNTQPPAKSVSYDSNITSIHVLVALCDNKYQGIVPVPVGIGNGQNPATNLYWGCAYGVSSYFKNSSHWTLLRQQRLDSIRLQRLIFKHKKTGTILVADAYDGRYIKQCTIDMLSGCSGQLKDTVQVSGKKIGIYGNARLVAYIGHDGLMDFKLTERFANVDGRKRDAIILACYSKNYFTPFIKSSSANALVWSTGLMSPEAYTLHDAVENYLSGQNPRMAAAAAYSRYQHCSKQAALRLLVQE